MPRVMTIWLPRWPVQRRLLERPELRRVPVFVCRHRRRGVMTVVSWAWAAPPRRDVSASALGRPAATPVRIPEGMSLAEAMAVLALAHGSRACHIAEVDHDDPVADRQALEELARYCRRFAPLVALETVSSIKAGAGGRSASLPGLSPAAAASGGLDSDGPQADCLHLDVTGTAGFFGGEAALARTVTWTLAARGIHARAAIADTPAAAWAAARHTDLLHEGLRHADRPQAADRPARRRAARSDSCTAAVPQGGSVGRPAVPCFTGSLPTVPLSVMRRRHRRWAVVPAGEQLQMLAGLPTSALRLDAAAVAQLAEVGVDTIGGVARLPRKSLASRFDPHVSQRLAEFTGGLAEPLAVPSSAELPTASHAFDFPLLLADATADGLLEIVERLVRECIGPLATRGKGVVSLQVRLDRGRSSAGYGSSAPVVIDVGVFQPTASARHLVDLVRLRMARMRLPREIEGIAVEVVSAGAVVCRQRTLFGEAAETSAAEVGMLLDRLSGRLGRTAVFAPVPVADAQPEHAWAPLPPAHPVAAHPVAAHPVAAQRPATRRHAAGGRARAEHAHGHAAAGAGGTPVVRPERRPIWMLPQPVRLEVVSVVGTHTHAPAPPARFRFGSRMHDVVRSHGPERIETAWWRGPTVRRDYYVVETRGGGRYWIFRRLGRGALAGEWFLHGTFS